MGDEKQIRLEGRPLLSNIQSGLFKLPDMPEVSAMVGLGTVVFRVQLDGNGFVKAATVEHEDFYRSGADQEGEGNG